MNQTDVCTMTPAKSLQPTWEILSTILHFINLIHNFIGKYRSGQNLVLQNRLDDVWESLRWVNIRLNPYKSRLVLFFQAMISGEIARQSM
jgi:hypothetical protein